MQDRVENSEGRRDPVGVIRKTAEMMPEERVLAALARKEPDQVPHFEWVHSPSVIKAVTGGDDYLDLVEALDLDGIALGAAYRYEQLGPNLWKDEWGPERIIADDGYPVVVEGSTFLKTWEDLAAWEPPDPDDPYRYEPLKAAAERFGGYRAIVLRLRDVFSCPRDYMGYEHVMISMALEPDLVSAVIEKTINHYLRILERAVDIGVTCVVTGDDIADNRGPLFSPQLFKDLMLPHYRRLVDAVHSYGLKHLKHSDGNMYPFLDIIADAGSDLIDPVDPKAGMTLKEVKARYGDRMTIKGNIDQVDLLRDGSPQDVVEAVKKAIVDAGVGGGYICSSSNSIHPGVDIDLYRTMIAAIREYGKYPLDIDRLSSSVLDS
jgi:uroporphyrinogen decarboxylase